MPNHNLVIGYPHNGMVHELFMCSLLEFQYRDQRDRGVLHSSCGAMGTSITDNRNRLVRRVLAVKEIEWLLFVDTDIVFRLEDVYRLLDHKTKIVTGLYFGRPGTFTSPVPLWYERIGDTVDIIKKIEPVRPQKIDGCGMGFCLVHRSVLEAFPVKDGDEDWVWFGRDLYRVGDKPIHISEDLTFCYRARKLGFEIWGDHAVRVAHLKTSALDWDCFIRESGTVVGVRQPEGQAAEPTGTARMVQLDDPRSGPRSEGGRHLGPKLVAAAVRNGTIR